MHTQRISHHKELDVLAQQFARWRQSRSSRSEKIPEGLLGRALELSRSLPSKSVVLKKLRINHTQLKRHAQAKKPQTAVQHCAVEFVPLPVQPVPSLTNASTVQWTRQDGHKMTISNLNKEQLSHCVSLFIQPVVHEKS